MSGRVELTSHKPLSQPRMGKRNDDNDIRYISSICPVLGNDLLNRCLTHALPTGLFLSQCLDKHYAIFQ